jgi:general secretion pathway protein H
VTREGIARKCAARSWCLNPVAGWGPARARAARDGWSLIELLVVLAILALVAAVALPGTPILGRGPSLSLVTADMAARLRAARSMAIAQNRDIAFTLDTDRRTYGVAGVDAAHTIPATIGLSITTARTLIRENGNTQLVFFRDGTSTGGTIRLADQHQVVAIGVEWLTGAVHIERGTP